MHSQLLFSLLPITALAHFTLDSPTSRHFDEDTLAQFPCGGQNTPSANRTQWSLTGGPIQLTMEHDEAAVQVLLGIGNDPGVNFNITLLPTIQEQGIGQFCLGDVLVPEGMATEGMNATIQVVTNGDPNGGLYNVSLPSSTLLQCLSAGRRKRATMASFGHFRAHHAVHYLSTALSDINRSAQTSPSPHLPPPAPSAKMGLALEQLITLASSPMLTVQAQPPMLAVQPQPPMPAVQAQLVKPALSES